MKIRQKVVAWWLAGDPSWDERRLTYEARLQAALARRRLPERLLHDLEATGLVEREHYAVRAPVFDHGFPGQRLVAIEQNGLVATLLPWIDDSETCVSIGADSLQQLVEEETAPWPKCPEHDHALHSLMVGRVWRRAHWVLPQERRAAVAGWLPP